MKKINLLLLSVIMIAAMSCESKNSRHKVAIKPVIMKIYCVIEYSTMYEDSVVSIHYIKAFDQYDADRTYNEMYYGPKGIGQSYKITQCDILNDSIR